MKGTVVYPGHTINGLRVDVLGYVGDVDIGARTPCIMKGPNVCVRRAGDETANILLLRANQVVLDVPKDFDVNAPIENLGELYAEAHKHKIAVP